MNNEKKPGHIHRFARRFELHRDEDESGVSGTGLVASGVCWQDGTAALRWHTEYSSTAVYVSMADVRAIHGHGGKTRIVWIDLDCDQEWSCVMCGGGSGNGACFDCGASGSTALVPLWWADDMRRRRHLIWDSGVRAASGKTEAEAKAMREGHEREDLRRAGEQASRRKQVDPADARSVVWVPPCG